MAGFVGKDTREFMRALHMESTAKPQQEVPSPQGSQRQGTSFPHDPYRARK